MHRLNRYVNRTVMAAMLLVLAVLVGLDVLGALIEETGSLSGDYGFAEAARYVALSVPGNLFSFLPFAALVGVLAGLGLLAGSSELVVMRSAGVSVLRLVWMALKPALVLALVGLLIAEYVAPNAQQIADSARARALQQDRQLSRHGLWHREGHQFMHFNAVEPNGVLYGVTIYVFDEDDSRHLSAVTQARRASYQQGFWLLEDVRETRLFADHTTSSQRGNQVWNVQLTPELLNILALDPDDLSISGLYRYGSYLIGQGLRSGEYRLAFWNKLLQPLAVVSLVLVAASMVFGSTRQTTMGYRIFLGVIIGIVFRTSQDMLGPASLVYGFQPLYAALAPIAASALVGLLLLHRAARV
ncbi:MAG TPA: LPS export ABC transporter permease LptG [Spongiibacteraceae bacterium]|jgi:lipopolysaccharide export system permease protein|nr:LPS export ABC transporter permease LptG [Spongiibacteraceae bacterium]HUH37513.1 LPS export ABC transporter permease LptG [Spongiibacteraceae bacterium]